MSEPLRNKGLFDKLKEPTSSLLISSLTLITTLPVFITVYKYVPLIVLPIDGGFRIDHILTFILVFMLLYIIIKKLSKLVYVTLILGLAGLLISTYFGNYGVKNLYYDYAAMLYNLDKYGIQLKFEEKKDPFSKQAQIVHAVDYQDKEVRKTATNWAIKNFSNYKSVIPSLKVLHALSIFNEVRVRWNYVYDPHGEDYYAKASETLQQLEEDDKLKGDCDDYAIVMAGLIRATGGDVQLVRTEIIKADGTVIGHLYPEVNIGDQKDLETVAYLIKNKLFAKESLDKSLYYYIDENGEVWLNFDYNDYYPGGPYQSLYRESVLKI